MIRKVKKIISLTLAFVLVFSMSTTAFAKEAGNTSNGTSESVGDYADILNEYGLDGDLIMKTLEVSDHLFFNETGTALVTDLSDEDLSVQYGFSNEQIADFHAILNGTYQPPALNGDFPATIATRYYLSNDDLTAGVFAALASAALAGPEALMAAWTALSTALAGPLGTVAGIAVAALGSVFFADLALKITGALVEGKGVAFYLDWGIPPVTVAIE